MQVVSLALGLLWLWCGMVYHLLGDLRLALSYDHLHHRRAHGGRFGISPLHLHRSDTLVRGRLYCCVQAGRVAGSWTGRCRRRRRDHAHCAAASRDCSSTISSSRSGSSPASRTVRQARTRLSVKLTHSRSHNDRPLAPSQIPGSSGLNSIGANQGTSSAG